MPGKRGKRARSPQACSICHKPINGDFLRIGKADDRHIECEYPNGPNGGPRRDAAPKEGE